MWETGSVVDAVVDAPDEERREMGKLVEGTWKDVGYEHDDGRFKRDESAFRAFVGEDDRFPVARDRYRLYVSLACPWAHRTLVARALLGLEEAIPVTVVDPLMLERGWTFSEERPDPLYGASALYELYQRAKADYSGRVTVPVLWDTARETIVNNESAEILRMLNGPLKALGRGAPLDLYPEALRGEIDAVNDRVYDTVNNGVYKAGFAGTQEAYDEAVGELFATLDWLEARLDGHEWLVGDRLTEADIRLWTTLVRFDPVYHVHFKCNVRRLVDYPRLWALTRRLYAEDGVAATVDLDYTKTHYYGSHRFLNPKGIVPRGPAVTAVTPDGAAAPPG